MTRARREALGLGRTRYETRDTADEDILQIAAVEEYPVVSWARDETQRASNAFHHCDAELQILDEDALAVVAEVRNHDERYIRFIEDGIGSHTRAEADVEIPVADSHAVLGWGIAAVRGACPIALSGTDRGLRIVVRRRSLCGLTVTVRGDRLCDGLSAVVSGRGSRVRGPSALCQDEADPGRQ